MSFDTATVTCSLESFDAQRNKILQLEQEVVRLRRLERQERLTQVPESVQALEKGMKAARIVVAWAAGMLPAEEVKGWPAGALHEFAEALRASAPAPEDDDSDVAITANDLLAFAREVRAIEAYRKTRDEALAAAVPALAAPATPPPQ